MPKEKSQEKRKEKLFYSPMDFLKNKCHIELEGNNTVVLEGSKGVLEYSEECIRISVESYIVSFEGRGLNLKCISPTALTIKGCVLNISFSD